VAAAYAGGCTSHDIEKVALSMRFGDVARWTINRQGLAGSDRMISFLAKLLKENRFERMKMPCAIVATDLATGQPVTFQGQGDAVLAIRASCSYPGLYVPVHHENRCLVDGFISMEIPAQPLREMGATHVISVFLPTPAACSEPGNLFAVINRCFQVMSARSAYEWRSQSDLVIEPDVAGLSWDSFASAQKLIELGEKAAEAAIPRIQAWVGAGSELALAV
jgi:NTE family protein